MSTTRRNQIVAYIFNPALKTIVLSNLPVVELKRIISIINLSRGVVYYKAGDLASIPSTTGNLIALNSSISTVGHASTDEIHIAYIEDDPGVIPATWRSAKKWLISTASTMGSASAWSGGVPTFAIKNSNGFPVRVVSLEFSARVATGTSAINNQNLPIQANIYLGPTSYVGGTALAVVNGKTYALDPSISSAFMPASLTGSSSASVGDGNINIVPYQSNANVPVAANQIYSPKWAEGLIIPASGMLALQGQAGFGGPSSTVYATMSAVLVDELL
jgi:hypothetical protein